MNRFAQDLDDIFNRARTSGPTHCPDCQSLFYSDPALMAENDRLVNEQGIKAAEDHLVAALQAIHDKEHN